MCRSTTSATSRSLPTSRPGDEGIFLEATGGDSPVPVIEVGDPLFGSTATQVNLGRFSLNDRDRISFFYVLADGREGIAIASLQHGKDR